MKGGSDSNYGRRRGLEVQPGSANNVLRNPRRRGEGGGSNIKDALPAHINPSVGARGRLQLALYYTPVTPDADRTTLSPRSSSVAKTCRTQFDLIVIAVDRDTVTMSVERVAKF